MRARAPARRVRVAPACQQGMTRQEGPRAPAGGAPPAAASCNETVLLPGSRRSLWQQPSALGGWPPQARSAARGGCRSAWTAGLWGQAATASGKKVGRGQAATAKPQWCVLHAQPHPSPMPTTLVPSHPAAADPLPIALLLTPYPPHPAVGSWFSMFTQSTRVCVGAEGAPSLRRQAARRRARMACGRAPQGEGGERPLLPASGRALRGRWAEQLPCCRRPGAEGARLHSPRAQAGRTAGAGGRGPRKPPRMYSMHRRRRVWRGGARGAWVAGNSDGGQGDMGGASAREGGQVRGAGREGRAAGGRHEAFLRGAPAGKQGQR
jgi:hypothetical protein